MKKNILIAIVVVVLALAVVAVFALTQKTDEKDTTNDKAAVGNAITYTDNGFSPPTLRVVSGTEITVKNDSSRELQFSSDEHPVHTENTELNLDALPPGGSQTLTVTKRGTWHYHDHQNPDKTGTIIVE